MKHCGLIFDHDGTLVDSESLHFDCWQRLMADFGVDFSESEYIEKYNGVPTIANAQMLIDTYSLSVSVPELVALKQRSFKQHSEAQPPAMMPKAEKTLEEINQQGFKMAIATGAASEDLQRSVEAHGLQRYFSAMATRSEVAAAKPAADVYLLACERLKVDPSRSIAFEDTATGIASAKAAGLYCIAVVNAYSQNQDLSQADASAVDLYQAWQHAAELIRQC